MIDLNIVLFQWIDLNAGYFDVEDLVWPCIHCGAFLWCNERIQKHRDTNNPKFRLCCGQGKIQIPLLENPPTLLMRLLNGEDPRSSKYMENIRAYNMMFSFTSLGRTIDNELTSQQGIKIFCMGGQNYHSIGSLLPNAGSQPKFAQLYIFDTDNEISNRLQAYRFVDLFEGFLILIFVT